MTPAQVLARIDELMQIARARIDASPHKPGQSYSEIMWLTQEEAQELLKLRISLPTYKQERDAAMQRLREKRRLRHPAEQAHTPQLPRGYACVVADTHHRREP